MKKILSACLFSALAFSLSCAPHHLAQVSGPKEGFDFYFNEGIKFMQSGDYGKAIESLNMAAAVNPGSARTMNLLGLCYLKNKDTQKAKALFEKAIDLNPAYAQAYTNLGGAYFVLRDYSKAKGLFEKSIQLDPQAAAPYYSLGNLLIIQGKNEDGLNYLSKGMNIDPEQLEKHRPIVLDFSPGELKAAEFDFIYARLYASAGNVKKTVEYLEKADNEGFRDWMLIEKEKDFDPVREDPAFQAFLRSRKSR